VKSSPLPGETHFQGRLHTAVAGVAGSCEVVATTRGGCKLLWQEWLDPVLHVETCQRLLDGASRDRRLDWLPWPRSRPTQAISAAPDVGAGLQVATSRADDLLGDQGGLLLSAVGWNTIGRGKRPTWRRCLTAGPDSAAVPLVRIEFLGRVPTLVGTNRKPKLYLQNWVDVLIERPAPPAALAAVLAGQRLLASSHEI
jgi:hypothetical protein